MSRFEDGPSSADEPDVKLCDAVWDGNEETVKDLIILGADVNTFSQNGNTPLHLAIEQGYLEIIKILVQSGADVNLRDTYGLWTPLLHAVDQVSDAAIQRKREPNNEIIVFLLENGANPMEETSAGETAMMIARHYGNHAAEEILQEAQKGRPK